MILTDVGGRGGHQSGESHEDWDGGEHSCREEGASGSKEWQGPRRASRGETERREEEEERGVLKSRTAAGMGAGRSVGTGSYMDVVNCSPSPAERRGGSTNRQPIAFKTDDGIRGAESPSMVTTASTLCASMPPQILARARSRREHRRPSQSPLIVQACWNDRVRSRCAVRDSASCKKRR